MKSFHKKQIGIGIVFCLLWTSVCASAAPTQTFPDLLADEGLDPTNAGTLSHVQRVEESAEALGAALTMEGIYFDGTKLLIGWRTENLRPQTPVLVLYTEATVDGIPIHADADHPLYRWWPDAFGLFVAGDPINNLMERFVVADAGAWNLQGYVEVACHFQVKRPTKPLVIVDPDIHIPYDDQDTEADRQAMIDALKAHGVTIAPPEDGDIARWQALGYLAVNLHGEPLAAGPAGDVIVLSPADLPDVTAEEVTLTFGVDLDALRGL